jgi:hypothetical protein
MHLRVAILAIMAASMPAETLDRIAVTVGREVITESEILRELRVTAFLDRKPLDLGPAAKRKAAQRLVDQTLILREATESHVTLTAEGDSERLIAQVKSAFSNEDEYHAAMTLAGITQTDLSRHLLAGLRSLKFTDLRFRASLQIPENELREYYESLLDGWRGDKPAETPSFEDSREQIEALLTEQRSLEALDRWLAMARAEYPIQYREQVFQ